MKDTLAEILRTKISSTESRQYSLASLIKHSDLVDRHNIKNILDLGCGEGRAFEGLKNTFPNLRYFGLDIEASPEVSKRKRSDIEFCSYDGVNIPFDDEFFDAIHCRQVLEHVRQPDAVVAEAARVLKPGALFMGSVSQLEPYHSHSIFNWTAYGVVTIFEGHGLEIVQIAPGIDGVTLTLRRILGADKFSAFFSRESLLNHYIELQLKTDSKSEWERNLLKVIVAGHIIFLARKV